MEKLDILGVPIDNVTMQEALDGIESAVDARRKQKVFFVNTFYLNVAWGDAAHHAVLCRGDRIFGDGSGVRLASKIVRTPIVDNVNGTDMIFPLCELCQRRGFRIFLLGSKPGVADGLKAWMETRYPGIQVAGAYHGYFDREKDRERILSLINDGRTDILLVGFSAPLQELWIEEHAERLTCPVMMGVGGLFDVYAGDIHRPATWLRKLGLEWVGRLFQEPRRLWRRYLVGNPQFLARVACWKYLGIAPRHIKEARREPV